MVSLIRYYLKRLFLRKKKMNLIDLSLVSKLKK